MKGKKQKNDNKNIKVLKEIIVFLLPLILIILTDIFFVAFNFGEFLISTSIVSSILIIYSIFLLLYGITKKSGWAISIIAVGLLLLTIINQLKIAYTGEPIIISDLQYLGQTRELVQLIDDTFLEIVKSYIPELIGGIIIFILLIIVVIKTTIIIENKKIRLSIIIIPSILLVVLFYPSKFTKNLYLKVFFNDEQNNVYVSNAEYYMKNGFLSGIYGQMLDSRVFKPNGYDEDLLIEELNSKEVSMEVWNESVTKPNIIVILSESFWDISKLEEIKFDKDITPNFNKLKSEGVLFEMISPSYGGITANVEMELLTGFNLSYYHKGYTPYLQLYGKKKEKNMPSIIDELNNNGYTTKIASCTNEGFYNREVVYKNMGVDETIFLHNVDKANNKGYYLSDAYLTNLIINQMNTKEKQEKLFFMALTIQQHMPYVIDKYGRYDLSIINSNLDKEKEETVLAYAQGVYDADKQLGAINNYINSIEEPTLVVFFGDHLPYLKTAEGKDVIDELKYFNTGNETLNNYRRYNTEAIVISNYNIKDESIKYISPDLLMPYILNKTNLKLSSYYKYLANTVSKLPSYNRVISSDIHGNINKIIELNETQKKQYELREQIQYMLFIK